MVSTFERTQALLSVASFWPEHEALFARWKVRLDFQITKLPIPAGCRSGVARACTLRTICDAGVLGDERYLVFECAALAGLRAKCVQ